MRKNFSKNSSIERSLTGSKEKICMIMGNDENIKLTTPVDLLFGEAILKRRGDL
ncbi:MAG: hypothetical protein LBF82_03415 [Lactobacillales bacterium]|jgi:2-C-methyl-D-erythritol 4-phosphate cytidylyltransferase|nr:hypothetical protein [Lactobacillales bacterium]